MNEDLYERAKDVARRIGFSLAELCRRGLEEMVGAEPSDRPWMRYAGVLGGRSDDGATVDAVAYDRETP